MTMVYQPDSAGYKQINDKIQLKVVAHGPKTLMAHFKLKAGAVLDKHSHPHEQIGYLISGKLKFEIDGQDTFIAEPGAAWCIDGDVAHQADVLEDSVVVEIFHPVREDFLKL